jgi:hypothetical protein
MNHSDLRFPVDEAYLARVKISPEKYAAWKTKAEKQVFDAVQDVNSWYFRGDIYSQAFKSIADRKGLKGYLNKKQEKGAKKEFYCEANLDLTLEDITYGIHCEKTFEQRSINAHLYSDAFLDGAVLDVHETSTYNDPFQFVGMKWLAINPSGAGLLIPRDYIFFEYSGTTMDAEGRKVLFQFLETKLLERSKEIKENDFGFSRGNFFMLNLYRTEKESVHATCRGNFTPSGNTPNWMAVKGIQVQFSSIMNINGLADARAVVATGLMKSIVPPKKHHHRPKDCIICKRKFNLLRLKHTCRACGEISCRHCVVKLKFYNQQSNYSASTLPVVCEKFCLRCVHYARKERNALKRQQLTPQVSEPGEDTVVEEPSASTSVDSVHKRTSHQEDLSSSTADTVMSAHSMSLESTSELRISSIFNTEMCGSNDNISNYSGMCTGGKSSLSYHTHRRSLPTFVTSKVWSEDKDEFLEQEEENENHLCNQSLRASVCGRSDELLSKVSSRTSFEGDIEFLREAAARKRLMYDRPMSSEKAKTSGPSKDKKMVLLDLDAMPVSSSAAPAGVGFSSTTSTTTASDSTCTIYCFDDLAKSIAMQNSLIQSIQRERLHQQQMRYGLNRNHGTLGGRLRTSQASDESSRFEVLD